MLQNSIGQIVLLSSLPTQGWTPCGSFHGEVLVHYCLLGNQGEGWMGGGGGRGGRKDCPAIGRKRVFRSSPPLPPPPPPRRTREKVRKLRLVHSPHVLTGLEQLGEGGGEVCSVLIHFLNNFEMF
jgi:hypothetical protein